MIITNKIRPYLFTIVVFFLATIIGCKDQPPVEPAMETGTVMDVDNNVYKTVKIGNQWWMTENLKVTKYQNGTAIYKAQSNSEWINKTTGAYCIYDNNNVSPGFLYNWHAINDTNNIAPIGWHVPSDDEWKELEKHLGMSPEDADKVNWRGTLEGEKLKMEAPKGWIRHSNIWGTNESGFSALAGACRLFNGTWGDPGLFATGFWWSATEHGKEAWYRHLDYKKANVFRFYGHKNEGFSIRCVKDE